MRISRVSFYTFVISFLVFFWRTTEFWFNFSETENSQKGGALLYAALVMVEAIALWLVTSSPKFKNQQSRIPQLCVLWEVVMLVVLIYNHTFYSQWFKCFAWPLFFQASYLFIRSDMRLVKSFRKAFFVLALMGGIYFVYALRLKAFEYQTNMVYFFLLTVPALLLTPQKRQRYFLLILATFVAFISMKRSMILAFALFWGLVELKDLLSRGKKKYAIILSVVMIIATYGSFTVADDLTNGRLIERLNSEDKANGDVTNGREAIYLVTIEMINSSSLDHLILGNGHNAVRHDSIMEKSAHNEFLEIIYDYGVIILLIYICFWGYILKQWYFHYRHDTVYFLPYTLSVCLFAVMAMVSQLVLYCSHFLYLVMFWGIVAALKDGKMNYRC